MVCTCYKDRISQMKPLIECFIDAWHSADSFVTMRALQAFVLCLSNLRAEIQSYLPGILSHLTESFDSDACRSQMVLQFLMCKISLFHALSSQVYIDALRSSLRTYSRHLIQSPRIPNSARYHSPVSAPDSAQSSLLSHFTLLLFQ